MSSTCFYDKEPCKCLQRQGIVERHVFIFSPPFSSVWVTPLLLSSSCPAANCPLISWQLALGEILLFQWWWKVMASPSSKESQKSEKPSGLSSFQEYIVYIHPSPLCSRAQNFIPASAGHLGGCRQMVHCQAPISLIPHPL